jgi:hypothetical protein
LNYCVLGKPPDSADNDHWNGKRERLQVLVDITRLDYKVIVV